MENDIAHIETLYNECLTTLTISQQQGDWLESVRKGRIETLTNPAKSNRMPAYV